MSFFRKIPPKTILLLGMLLAFIIRLLFVPNPGFEADVSFWKSWGLAVADHGLVKGLALTNFNYPTPFGYVLFVMVKLYSFFADPHAFNDFWRNNNILFLFISKLPAILADFGIAGIFLLIGKNPKKWGFPPFPWYWVLPLLYLFNPISVMDGAWWGQLDALGVVIFLGAVLLLLRKQPFLAGVVFMVSMMTKLQNMIYGPLFFLFLWQWTGWQGLLQGIAGALMAFIGTNIEYVYVKNFGRVMESVVGNYDYFPWLSLNAFNPWWVLAGGYGMGPTASDKILTLGLASAKNVGLYIFSGAYLFAALRQWKLPADAVRKFFENFILVNGAFFLFQTESHERYAFPVIVILLFLAPFYRKHLKPLLVAYGIFSLLYFYNLDYAMQVNYPQNGIPISVNPLYTMPVAFFFTGAYLVYAVLLTGGAAWMLPVAVGAILLALTAKNVPLILRQPVYLDSLTPITAKQDYGSFQKNMPINAGEGPKRWSNLSVQYAFYRHGIGTHANSEIVYHINNLFRTFSFDYGIDTEAGQGGSVTFEVWSGDRRLFASEKITRYEFPRHADIDVRGVYYLRLVVRDGGDGITDDHADWLNAKFYE